MMPFNSWKRCSSVPSLRSRSVSFISFGTPHQPASATTWRLGKSYRLRSREGGAPSCRRDRRRATLVMLVSVADLFDEARMALFPARLEEGQRQAPKQRPNQYDFHRAESNARARGHGMHIL